MLMLSKEQFLVLVWGKIKQHSCGVIDAVIETAEANNLDMETAAKIINRDAPLKSLLEQEARRANNLKAV